MSAICCAQLPSGQFKTQMNCNDCAIKQHCLPYGLNEMEVGRLESIIKRHRPLQKREHLYRAGEAMHQIFALRSGSLKTYRLSEDGTEQITGFHLPGELIGLDAIGFGFYRSYAVAMETTLICTISLNQLEELTGAIPNLRKRFLNALSREIHHEHQHLSRYRESAEQRLGLFLLNLSARYNKRGLSASQFVLPMSRGEIANYLGLTIETVSRLFTRYRQLGLIDSHGREIHIYDPQALCRLSSADAIPHTA